MPIIPADNREYKKALEALLPQEACKSFFRYFVIKYLSACGPNPKKYLCSIKILKQFSHIFNLPELYSFNLTSTTSGSISLFVASTFSHVFCLIINFCQLD